MMNKLNQILVLSDLDEKFDNPNLIEHPHGGMILSYSIKIPKSTQISNNSLVSLELFLCTYNNISELWNNPKKIYSEITNKDVSHLLFLNLKGNLQLLVNRNDEIISKESPDYGKTWVNEYTIYHGTFYWRFTNQPLYVGFGQLLIPLYNSENGRSFVLINNEAGKDWYPSTYIEFPENDTEDFNPDEDFNLVNLVHTKSPVLIHQSDILITIYMQSENLKQIYYSESIDLGETWSESTQLTINSSKYDFDGLRIKDSSGNYTPEILLLFISEELDDNFNLNLAYSDNNGMDFNKNVIIDSKKGDGINFPKIIQNSDTSIHVIYKKMDKLIHSLFDIDSIRSQTNN